MKIIGEFLSLFILTVLGMETEFGQFESDPFGYNMQESDPDEPSDDDTELQQEAPLKKEMEAEEEQEDTHNKLDAQQKSCSLQSCIDTLNAIESRAKNNKKLVEESVLLMSSCSGCSNKVSNQLLKSLKSCTNAISAYTICKKTYSSCADIKKDNPSSQSSTYRITINNRNIQVYCDMGTLCGVGGGWTRLGKLDMMVSSAKCPSSLCMVIQSGNRICTKNKADCNSVSIPSQGVPY
uniref:Fibrinogen C-terminal domain-containing protein n=1 Tax=Amphimedon queenslandica TaxID=400682 RepID=A0A1X7UPL7_AMPQE